MRLLALALGLLMLAVVGDARAGQKEEKKGPRFPKPPLKATIEYFYGNSLMLADCDDPNKDPKKWNCDLTNAEINNLPNPPVGRKPDWTDLKAAWETNKQLKVDYYYKEHYDGKDKDGNGVKILKVTRVDIVNK